ncbi:MAG: transcription termination factor Rho [Candidatus Cloacimonadota bacterium]|nr:MAG: transcription termination factor Rho [Candidatus Cloacimonadota bacterium]
MEENQTPEVSSTKKETTSKDTETNEIKVEKVEKVAKAPRKPRAPRKPKVVEVKTADSQEQEQEQEQAPATIKSEVSSDIPENTTQKENTSSTDNNSDKSSETTQANKNYSNNKEEEDSNNDDRPNHRNNHRNNNNRPNNSRANSNNPNHPSNKHNNSRANSNNPNHPSNKHNNTPNNNNNPNNKRRNFKDKSKPLKTRFSDLIAEPEEIIRQKAEELEIQRAGAFSVEELSYLVYKAMVEAENSGLSISKGILEILPDGYGFLRDKICRIGTADVYVSNAQIKRLSLKTGDYILGQTRTPKDNESYHALLRVELINDMDPDDRKKLTSFEKLVPIYPNQKFDLHNTSKDTSTRIIDLITPIGKGQRGLIVAPPKAGKTTLIKQIANALTTNHPDIVLFVLLIDERPEEVTDMTRSIAGEVVASTFDQHLTNHIRISEMVLERSKRMVEQGKDVVILLDSITRLARAYNIAIPSSGQTLSGGVNPLALYKPKKFFGSARNIEFGGSLTILATALVDTGSKMDEIIFEEFKGTGNMELHLDRQLFNKRVFPAINLPKSSTRREELLVDNTALRGVNMLRRVFETLSPQESIDLLKKHMRQSKNNVEFLEQLQKQTRM